MADQTVTLDTAPIPEVSSTFLQIAVLASLAATGTLATNILLPSLPQMAASLHVSTPAVTASITVFLGDSLNNSWWGRFGRFVGAGRYWQGLPCFSPAASGAASPRSAGLLTGRVVRPLAPARPRCCRAPSPAISSPAQHSAAPWR
jgi:DHA1 family bicyclomycin/chloramphenicol resistance-like MFS transporter